MRSREGHTYTAQEGLTTGLETDSVVPVKHNYTPGKLYDAVVIGAGFAGLTAARDLCLTGHSVLLVEARDRVGGRTWAASVNGEMYEMGGTWVHWQQGYVWRELKRYGIERDLKYTPDGSHKSKAYAVTLLNGKRYEIPSEDLAKLNDAYYKFCDVDGIGASSVIPIPTALTGSIQSNPELLRKYDQMTIADRVAEVRAAGLLSETELAYLIPFFALASGSNINQASFLEAIKWFVIANKSFTSVFDMCTGYKIAKGTTHLANLMFSEAQQSGNLSWAFDAPVSSVEDTATSSTVTTSIGAFRSRRVICTLPLNVANRVNFMPPLSQKRSEAFKIGHIHKGDKIHFEIRDGAYRSWSGSQYTEGTPLPLVMAHGDQTLENGSSTLVGYSCEADNAQHVTPSSAPASLPQLLAPFDEELPPLVLRTTFHEWYTDPYAMGGWSMAPAKWTTLYLDECQKRHGRTFWASGDWADGWKGFIDGAIEQGTRAAYQAKQELGVRTKL